MSAASRTADASLTDAAAAEPKQTRKARSSEKAHGKRLARDTARNGTPRERTASNQQDDYYYSQRQGNSQGYAQRPAYAPAYAYAPQQSYGPFTSGGWNRGW
jgi:hypothetical protein